MFNNKGGVGKTTLTCNLAAFSASVMKQRVLVVDCDPQCNASQLIMGEELDRKSTRLNSSHVRISYAVFCLKKKKKKNLRKHENTQVIIAHLYSKYCVHTSEYMFYR